MMVNATNFFLFYFFYFIYTQTKLSQPETLYATDDPLATTAHPSTNSTHTDLSAAPVYILLVFVVKVLYIPRGSAQTFNYMGAKAIKT